VAKGVVLISASKCKACIYAWCILLLVVSLLSARLRDDVIVSFKVTRSRNGQDRLTSFDRLIGMVLART
jgi:hypothetical protein